MRTYAYSSHYDRSEYLPTRLCRCMAFAASRSHQGSRFFSFSDITRSRSLHSYNVLLKSRILSPTNSTILLYLMNAAVRMTMSLPRQNKGPDQHSTLSTSDTAPTMYERTKAAPLPLFRRSHTVIDHQQAVLYMTSWPLLRASSIIGNSVQDVGSSELHGLPGTVRVGQALSAARRR